MVDDAEGSFKRPGAVPFNWEIRPGIPKTRTPQPDDDHGPTLLQPPKKLPPLRLKQLPTSNQSSPSSSSSSKTRAISPFAPPSSFKVKPADTERHSSGPPTPYFRSSSTRVRLDAGAALRRWRLLKSLIGFKKSSKSRDVKKMGEDSTSSESSDVFYESETTFSSPSEGSSSWSSPLSSLSSSRRGSTLKRNKSDLSSSEKKTIIMMARDRFG